ncbi:MAG: paraquat-inducible protein A [Gammaproteobacteria bacterium]
MKLWMGLALLFTAYLSLIPGLTQPMISLTGTLDKAEMVALGKDVLAENSELPAFIKRTATSLINQLHIEGSIVAYQKTRSILGTVRDLAESSNYLVAFLIMLFSVIVPILKGLMLSASIALKEHPIAHKGRLFSGAISKWSMADVFVIAIIVAYMAANASQQSGELMTLTATFGQGFYFFLGYCLLSIVSAQILASHARTTSDNRRSETL